MHWSSWKYSQNFPFQLIHEFLRHTLMKYFNWRNILKLFFLIRKIHNFSCQIKVVKSFLAYNRNNFTIFCLIKNSHFSRDFGLKYKNPNWRFSKFFHQLEFFSQSSWMELAGGIPARFFFVLLRLIPDENQFVLDFQNVRLVVFFAADALFLRTKSHCFFKQRWSSLY